MLKIQLSQVIVDKMLIIIDIIKNVANELKKGRTECVYKNAILCELQLLNIQYTEEETIPILYKDKYVGQERLDIILHNWLEIIFELKAVASDIKPEHYWQLINYMNNKKYKFGIVVNFNQSLNKNYSYNFIIMEDNIPYIFNTPELEIMGTLINSQY